MGERDERSNPFVYTPTPFIKLMLQGCLLVRETAGLSTSSLTLTVLDPCLGVSGRPQSATGQASLFTGVNAARMLGYHLNGFPNRLLRALLAREGVFLKLKNMGFRVTFLNAYRPAFFEDLKRGLKRYYSCSTMITYYAGVPFHSLCDLKRGQAVYADMTNRQLLEMGFEVPVISAYEAGKRLVQLARQYDFTLYEHFLTDIVGHTGDPEKAAERVLVLDQFIGSVAAHIDHDRTLVIITSDHGNLEDIREKQHTFNPVPALLIGHGHKEVASRLSSLVDVVPAIVEVLKNSRGERKVQ